MKKKTTRSKSKTKKKSYSSQNSLKLLLILLIALLGIIIFLNIKAINSKAPVVVELGVSYPSSYFRNYSKNDNHPSTTPTEAPLVGHCLYIPILTYHHIQPQEIAKQQSQVSLNVDSNVFDQQMAYLASSGYRTIWADELVNALRTKSSLPSKSIMITMDDGYKDNFNYALPILRKYGLKANLMLATGLVGSNPDMLNWDEVREMKNSGVFYITNHTWSHQSLTRTDQGKIENELDMAASQIKQYAGQDSNLFTYPYGELNSNAFQILQNKGYVGAFSTIPGFYQCDSFIMALHRNRIGNSSLSAYGL